MMHSHACKKVNINFEKKVIQLKNTIREVKLRHTISLLRPSRKAVIDYDYLCKYEVAYKHRMSDL